MRGYLKELSEYLISLKDNGFQITCNDTTIRISGKMFEYDEVKDDIIPFIHLMRSDHDIVVIITGHTRFKFFGLIKPKYITERPSISSIVNDTYKTDLNIREVDVKISKSMPDDLKKWINEFTKRKW